MKKIFAANWKLNKTPEESAQFISDFKKLISDDLQFFSKNEIFIFPSAFSLAAFADSCRNSQIQFGPQNIYSENAGAFTGENSATVAKQMGSQLLLIGHSERRQIFLETDSFLNQKMKLAETLQMTPIFCIGETWKEREANETEQVCFSQIEKGFADLDKEKRIVLAYEPVWAIGTGQVATPEQVADIHLHLYKKLKALGFKNFQLLYGGSVKPANSKSLLQIPHVDGFLIGGASLNHTSFYQICF